MTGSVSGSKPARSRWQRIAASFGPGIVVMLADTDAGSIVTAAQSGAQWGYRLLLLQFVLIPILYMVQELTVRLGIVTGEGHAVLIARHFGRFWAWLSVGTLLIACVGALLTELSGLAGIGDLLGVPAWPTMLLTVGTLCLMAITGSYRSVERIAIAIGGFEFAFLLVAYLARPSMGEVLHAAVQIPLTDPKYLLLVSANIGAVIMPWMVFYQQSATVEKGLTVAELKMARLDTALGSVVAQLIMAAVLIAAAAALGRGPTHTLDTVQDIAQALSGVLGPKIGQLCFGLGVAGAAIVAAIVVTLTASRTLGELLGYDHSLDKSVSEAPWFYGVYTLVLVSGAAIVLSGTDQIKLSVYVQVMNAMLLPIVLTFLFMLARRLPERYRLRGLGAVTVGTVIAVTAGLGLYAGVAGLFSN